MEEYLTIAEVALRLKIKPITIKNKMTLGVFERGVYSPQGLGPCFELSVIVVWLEEDQKEICEENDLILMVQQNL